MNDCGKILNTRLTAAFQPFCDNRSNTVEIEHHNIALRLSRIMESIQYRIEDMIKQFLKNAMRIKGRWLRQYRRKHSLIFFDKR